MISKLKTIRFLHYFGDFLKLLVNCLKGYVQNSVTGLFSLTLIQIQRKLCANLTNKKR